MKVRWEGHGTSWEGRDHYPQMALMVDAADGNVVIVVAAPWSSCGEAMTMIPIALVAAECQWWCRRIVMAKAAVEMMRVEVMAAGMVAGVSNSSSSSSGAMMVIP